MEKYKKIGILGDIVVFCVILIYAFCLACITTKLDNRCSVLEKENEELKATISSNETTIKNMKDSNELIIKENNKLYELLECSIVYEQELIEPLKTYDKELYYEYYMNMIDMYNLDPPETIYDYFTEDEVLYMQKCIETETYQCDFGAKVNVASVILNRVEHEYFPDNAIDVITSPKQFKYGRECISNDTELALEYAFIFGGDFEDAIYFQSSGYKETFNGAEYIGTDGYHWFYK